MSESATRAQVRKARAAAEPFKEDLIRRGVFLIPLPLEDDDNQLPDLERLEKGDGSADAKCAAAHAGA
jgi:hypothetical protein